MNYPRKPTSIKHRSQRKITTERRAKRERALFGVDHEPFHLTYPEPSDHEEILKIKYEEGYQTGHKKGERVGKIQGILKGLLAGIAISSLVVISYLLFNPEM